MPLQFETIDQKSEVAAWEKLAKPYVILRCLDK